jgi:hypothetical protein
LTPPKEKQGKYIGTEALGANADANGRRAEG